MTEVLLPTHFTPDQTAQLIDLEIARLHLDPDTMWLREDEATGCTYLVAEPVTLAQRRRYRDRR